MIMKRFLNLISDNLPDDYVTHIDYEEKTDLWTLHINHGIFGTSISFKTNVRKRYGITLTKHLARDAQEVIERIESVSS